MFICKVALLKVFLLLVIQGSHGSGDMIEQERMNQFFQRAISESER